MAYVITHPEMGIYLGNAFGIKFWSKQSPVGLRAITFETINEAEKVVARWQRIKRTNLRFVEVVADEGRYASVQSCMNAGLEGWDYSL